MKALTLILVTLTSLIVSCSDGNDDHAKPNSTAKLRGSITQANRIFVYEGLPRRMSDPALLKAEKERKDIVKIADYPFYTPQVEILGLPAAELKNFITDSKNFRPFSVEKECGGFHPDYAVTWSLSEKNYSILVCYGCGEVKIVDENKVYRHDARITEELKKLFSPFRNKS